MLFIFMEDFLKRHTGIALSIDGSCITYCLQCVLCSFQGTQNLYKFAQSSWLQLQIHLVFCKSAPCQFISCSWELHKCRIPLNASNLVSNQDSPDGNNGKQKQVEVSQTHKNPSLLFHLLFPLIMHQNKRTFHSILNLSTVDLRDNTALASSCLCWFEE